MYENSGRALPEGWLNSKNTTRRTKIELAMRSTRSTNQDARSCSEPSSDSKSYGETWNDTIDYRIPGMPLSTIEQQDTTRENKVKKLIGKFEHHQHKESFLQDLNQTEKMNKFSKESHELLPDMNNTEIFELCENSFKQQCPECNTYWEIGFIYCSCGRNMKSSQRPTEFEQNNYDVTSIPGYVIKKNSSRGAEHGPSERQSMYYQAKQMMKKARQKKHGNHTTILSRWYAGETYRTSLSRIGWKEKDKMLYDRIALEKLFYVATRAGRIQNSKHWILTLNSEGPQEPLNQRPDFAQAKRECKTIARRARGKDPARLQNHPSQSTSTTKKRTTVRRN